MDVEALAYEVKELIHTHRDVTCEVYNRQAACHYVRVYKRKKSYSVLAWAISDIDDPEDDELMQKIALFLTDKGLAVGPRGFEVKRNDPFESARNKKWGGLTRNIIVRIAL